MSYKEQVRILLEIDDICDEAQDESTLALNLVSYLAEQIEVDLVAFSLPDEYEPGRWKLQAVSDRVGLLSKLPMARLAEIAEDAKGLGEGKVKTEKFEKVEDLDTIFVRALPQHLNGEILGVLIVCSVGAEFDERQSDLLRIASTRMDSALRHIRVLEKLEQETAALRTVLNVDRIRDTSTSLDELLDRALGEVTSVIRAQAGFIMLYDRQGNRLELRAITGDELTKSEGAFKQLYKFSDDTIKSGATQHDVMSENGLDAVLGVPLILNDRVVGVLGVFNPLNRSKFTPNEVQLLEAISSQMDTAIFEKMETQRIREVFGRNVGAKVMHRLLQFTNDRDLLEGERVELSILFSDIRGFTSMSTKVDPNDLGNMIDDHFSAMTDVILSHEGTLDKFLGDGIMAFFNAPERQDDHADLAIRTALHMQQRHAEVMVAWEERGLPGLPIGIGVATGEVIVGNFGSKAHSEYSAIGSTVNLAARLCGEADGGQTLVSESTHALVNHKFKLTAMGTFALKGFGDSTPAWQVEA